MPIAASYNPATEKLDPNGGTSGTPHGLVPLCQLDEDGAIELLAAVGPAAGLTLDYQIRPGHQGAQILEVVLDSTNASAGDTVDFSGRDGYGCSLSENVDVSAGNGTYYTTARFSEMHHVDCTGFADAVGTIVINQNQWGVVLPRLGPELVEDGSFWDGTGWTIEAVWTIPGDGLAHGNGANGTSEELNQVGITTNGDIYRLEYTVSGISGGESVAFVVSGSSVTRTTNGTFVSYETATLSTPKFRGGGTGFSGTISNVSVRKLTGGFDIRANLDVGDGFTSTYFTSKDGEHVHFEDGYFFNIKTAATLDWGEDGGGYGKNGVSWSIAAAGDISLISNGQTGTWNIYGSRLIRRNNLRVKIYSGTVTALDSQFGDDWNGGHGVWWALSGTHSYTRCAFYGGVLLSTSPTFNDCFFAGTRAITSDTTDVTINNPRLLNNPIIRSGSASTITLNNPAGTFTPQNGSNEAIVSNLDTNIHISDRRGLKIASATVVCRSFGNITSPDGGSTFYKCIISHTSGVFADDLTSEYWEIVSSDLADAAGVTGVDAETGAWTTAVDYVKAAELFSVSTDSDGDIAQQTIDYHLWKGTSVPLQSLAPYTFTITKAGLATLVEDDVAPITIDDVVQPLVEHWELLPISTFVTETDVRAKILYTFEGVDYEGELGAAWGGGGDGALSVPAAIAALISADPQLASLLGRWDFGDGEAPAVFTVDPAPIDCPNPVIIIVQDGGVPNSVRGFRGLDLSGTITVWGEKTGSDRLMAQIAHLLWKLLARANPILSDYSHEGLIVGAGQKTDDPEGFSGYILNWDLTIAEQ